MEKNRGGAVKTEDLFTFVPQSREKAKWGKHPIESVKRTVTLRNRATGEILTQTLNVLELERVAIYGWFWSSHIGGWVICDNLKYNNRREGRVWVVNRGNVGFFRRLYRDTDIDESFPSVKKADDPLNKFHSIQEPKKELKVKKCCTGCKRHSKTLERKLNEIKEGK